MNWFFGHRGTLNDRMKQQTEATTDTLHVVKANHLGNQKTTKNYFNESFARTIAPFIAKLKTILKT